MAFANRCARLAAARARTSTGRAYRESRAFLHAARDDEGGMGGAAGLAMNLKNVATVTLFLFGTLGFAGCAADPNDTPDDEAPTTTSEAALKSTGGGPRLGYTCSGLMCTCTGDVDCNDMFGSGKCGDIASCDNSGPDPVCKCMITLGRRATRGIATSPVRASNAVAP